MFFQLHLISCCLYIAIRKENEQYMHSNFLSARLTSHMHAQTEACWYVWMFQGYSWQLPWTLCFWPILNLSASPFDPQLLAPWSVSEPTSGNLDLVSVIGLTGIRFSALPKKFWSKFCFSPWQVASDSIAHLNPNLLWLGWYLSQTGPGTVMEHFASLRNRDYCTVFVSLSALLCVPYR